MPQQVPPKNTKIYVTLFDVKVLLRIGNAHLLRTDAIEFLVGFLHLLNRILAHQALIATLAHALSQRDRRRLFSIRFEII